MGATVFQQILQKKNSYTIGLENSRLAEKKKKEKEEKEELEEEEEKDQIAFGLPEPQRQSQENVQTISGEELLLAILIDEAAEDIEQQIEAHRATLDPNHFDRSRPIGEASTGDRAETCGGRIIGANDVFVAVSHGRNIEIHRLANLLPNMQYDGKNPWHRPHEILEKGNLLNIRYKNGVAAFANVIEQRQELQQENVRQNVLSR